VKIATTLGTLVLLIPGPAGAHRPQTPAPGPAGPEALEAQIEALKPARLAWREIRWKTCLLEGLKEARQKKKPILLWVVGPGEALDGRC
jgi:hypothetical protein